LAVDFLRVPHASAGDLKAIAFFLNGAVFLGRHRPLSRSPVTAGLHVVGLLFAAPIVSWLALVLSFRKRVDPEIAATAKAATVVLNVCCSVSSVG